MVLHETMLVTVDGVDDVNEGELADFQAGFFAQFAAGGGFDGFAEFLGAPGQAPLVLRRGAAALDEEDFFAFQDNDADADERVFRVFACHPDFTVAIASRCSKSCRRMRRAWPRGVSSLGSRCRTRMASWRAIGSRSSCFSGSARR